MPAPMTLTGDANTPAMPMTDAQVNHLRRLLAWMRCEYTLDEHMQAGFLSSLAACAAHGIVDSEQASQQLAERAAQINHVPVYVRQAVKMLTKAIRDHETAAGIVDQQTS